MYDEENCSCDYCIEGPFYDHDKRVHFCEECHEEFLDNDLGCPGCEAYDRKIHEWKERRFFENN